MMVEVKVNHDEEGRPVALVPVDGCEQSPCCNYETGEGCDRMWDMWGDSEKGEREFVACNRPDKDQKAE